VRIVLRRGGPGDGSLPGDLANLKELLRQTGLGRGPGNGRGTAGVVVEVHESGQVVQLRLDHLRIHVESDLPQRIAAILHAPPAPGTPGTPGSAGTAAGVCELLGPTPLRQQPGYSRMLHRDSAAAAANAGGGARSALRRETADDEFCESIDRY